MKILIIFIMHDDDSIEFLEVAVVPDSFTDEDARHYRDLHHIGWPFYELVTPTQLRSEDKQ